MERKVFIAEEKGFTLTRSQFYYRNNVKAASFEAARSEITLTSKLRIFIIATFPVCMYAWRAWKRMRAYMRALADADLMCFLYDELFREAGDNDDKSRSECEKF